MSKVLELFVGIQPAHFVEVGCSWLWWSKESPSFQRSLGTAAASPSAHPLILDEPGEPVLLPLMDEFYSAELTYAQHLDLDCINNGLGFFSLGALFVSSRCILISDNPLQCLGILCFCGMSLQEHALDFIQQFLILYPIFADIYPVLDSQFVLPRWWGIHNIHSCLCLELGHALNLDGLTCSVLVLAACYNSGPSRIKVDLGCWMGIHYNICLHMSVIGR